jgi:hypothetical protein
MPVRIYGYEMPSMIGARRLGSFGTGLHVTCGKTTSSKLDIKVLRDATRD